MKRFLFAVLAFLLTGCAVDRPVKSVVANEHRIAKSALSGQYVFLKSVADIRYAGAKFGWMPPGFYIDHSLVVDFQIKETTLEITARHALPDRNPEIVKNRVLASFPIRHVDILRRQNPDGEDTHEEEETEIRRPWRDRAYIVVAWDRDRLDRFQDASRSSLVTRPLEIDTDSGSMQFSVQRHLEDGTLLTERYSFQRPASHRLYQRRPYPLDEQRRFGFFHASTFEPDAYGRFTQSRQQDWINRWDLSRPIVFHLSAGFPPQLRGAVDAAIARWNDAFFAATGKRPIEVRENTGQEPGDLRYNLIHFDDTENGRHGILGYGPTVTDPTNGRILKGDVFLYAAPFRRALYHERLLGPGEEPAVVTEERFLKTALPSQRFELREQALTRTSKPEPLVETLAQKFPDIAKIRESMSDGRFGEQARYLTPIDPAIGGALKRGSSKFSDSELETRVFQPLLSHELGHAFGLRHNFFASADEKHFHNGAPSSSVMDYGFLLTQEPVAAGPYDFAALRYAYGPAGDARDVLASGFYYCTDEDVYDSAQALCQPYDSGTTLTRFVHEQYSRYLDSYRLNNVRQDRVHFPLDSFDYLNRVARLLLPIRIAFDNATAILKVARRPAAPARLKDYWSVLGARIEADPKSKRITPLEISEPTERGAPPRLTRRSIDLAKIAPAVEDAQAAQAAAVRALLDVVRNPRPNFATTDSRREVQLRGILLDKLLALLVLVQPSDDPLDGGDRLTPYSNYRPAGARYLAKQLAFLIAGLGDADREKKVDPSPPLPNPMTAPPPRLVADDREEVDPSVDINLRRFALGLITRYLAVPSQTAIAHDQLFVERLNVPAEALNEVESIREEVAVYDKLKPHLQKSKTLLLDRISERLGYRLFAPFVPDGSILLAVSALPQLTELNRLDELIMKGEKATRDLPIKEKAVHGEALVAAPAWRARSRHRRIHKEIFRQQLLNDELGTFQLDALANQAKQNLEDLANQNLVYTSVLPAGDLHFRSYVELPSEGLPTISGYLIRDTINQLEDDRTVYRELASELRLMSMTPDVLREEATTMPASDAAEQRKRAQREAERRTRLGNLATRLESMHDPLTDRIASEKQLLWEIEDAYVRRKR